MGKKTRVSICMEDFYAASKAGHPAFKKHEKSGKTFVAVDIWENDEEDKFGNHFSVQLYDNVTRKPTYIGNGKKYDNSSSNSNQPNEEEDPLPY